MTVDRDGGAGRGHRAAGAGDRRSAPGVARTLAARRHPHHPAPPVAEEPLAGVPAAPLVGCVARPGRRLRLRSGWPCSRSARASAAVYFVNDVADAERDRRHPSKRNRPVASGALPAQHAVVLAVLAAVLAVGAGAVIREPLLAGCVLAYLCLSFLYSFRLKHVPYVGDADRGVRVLAAGAGRCGGHARPPVGLVPAGLQPGCPRGGGRQAVHRADRPGRRRRAAPAGDALVPAAACCGWPRSSSGVAACWPPHLVWASSERTGVRPWHLASALPLAIALIRFGVLTARGTIRPGGGPDHPGPGHAVL